MVTDDRWCVRSCMKRVALTLDERTITYLRGLVKSGECASLSHAVRKIVGHYMREAERGAEG